ncbi:RagB/SusD family nutrient uptake outer membrane protein [termite gut metagenome]|uniref:RagB/SusD family nutrient uptake outer membrane protein n=1 Tax=termite gut metagenome TaxID=433724 RepID=A0A5J4RHZ7_9ZZZZ
MKAEALNEQGLTAQAQIPLNKVRARAGLPGITTTDKAVMKEAIIKERRIELAFEGHRWFDLIRIDKGDYAIAFFHSIGKTNATKERLLWPIPQEEIDDNPLITQNAGY